jgi:hypothetical protein
MTVEKMSLNIAPSALDNLISSNAWVFWVELDQDEPEYLYGVIAPTKAVVAPPTVQSVVLPSGRELRLYEGVLNMGETRSLVGAAAGGVIDVSLVGGRAAPVAVQASRSSLVRALGFSGLRMISLATLRDLSSWLVSPDGAVALDRIEQALGFGFTGAFAGHIGHFDLIDVPLSRGREAIAVSLDRDAQNGDHVSIRREYELLDQHLVAHLILKCGDVVLEDRLVQISAGLEEVRIPAPPHVQTFEVSVFKADGGERVYAQTAHFITEIHMRGHVVPANPVRVADRLARKFESRPDLKQAASLVHGGRGWSDVISDPSNLLGPFERRVKERVALARAASLDRWFDRSLDSELGVIRHLIELIRAEGVRSAVLVDPFFGVEAMERLLFRLGPDDVDLTLATSWGQTDPDTAVRTRPNVNVRKLAALTDQAKGLVSGKIKIRNLIHRSGAQAFHDRYLLLRRGDGAAVVYLLSNSVNNMAGDWPFVMSALTGKAAVQAELYVESLVNETAVPASANLETNFRWPPV